MDLAPVSFNKQQAIAAMREKATFFIGFYLTDTDTPTPPFHIESFHMMTSLDVWRFALAIPRAHAKTTLAKLCAVYLFLFTPIKFIVYLSETNQNASNAIQDIIAFMESTNHISVFGKMEFIIRRESEGLYKFYMKWVDSQGQWRKKLCILKAQGAGQQVRGLNIDNTRPEVAIVDDLEGNETTDSEVLQKKMIRWFYGPFIKALARPRNKIIHIGNMLSKNCLLALHCHKDNDGWVSKLYGCLRPDNTPLWPEMWPMEELVKDYRDYAKLGLTDVWFAEMMNIPMAKGSSIITLADMNFAPTPDFSEIRWGFITVDPAISDKTWAHDTAIVAHGYDGIQWNVLEYIGKKGLDPMQLYDEILVVAHRWNIKVIGIESVAYQASIKSVFEYRAKIDGDVGYEFINMPHKGRKAERIITWISMVKENEYAVASTMFRMQDQMINFRPEDKTADVDILDAASYGPYMIEEHLELIQYKALEVAQKPYSAQSCYDVAEV